MSEAYWFGGLNRNWTLPSEVDAGRLVNYRLELLTSLTAKFGLVPARLNRVDWFTEQMNGLYRREALPAENNAVPLSFLWPALPFFSHTILQNACAGLILEESSLVALAEENQADVETVLLGSPAAVGKYNLVPHARIRAHFSAGWTGDPLLDSFESVSTALKRLAVEPVSIAALAFSGLIPPEEIKRPEVWQDTPSSPSYSKKGLLPALNWLAETMRDGEGSAGLLISFSADRRALFTLVEKV
ncbi:MAG: hypothetical protein AB9891_09515 [Anaerolineaceae bacterium]